MADNIVVNETTYNDVEAVSMVNENGEEILYYPDAVRYNAQNLTEAQKAQARENIGAITEKDAPVKSVNNKTVEVSLNASDVGARPNTWTPTAEEVGARPNTWTPSYSDVGADKSGTADSKVSAHNVSDASHNDIRLLIQGLADRINAIANSTDVDLDDFKEVVAYIKANRGLIDAITTNKINYTDIINDLVTNVTNKPLSAAQGVALKLLIDNLTSDKLDASALTSAINTALAQAKASGEFKGADGKTAYEYAKDGGYTGTEAEFATKLSKPIPTKTSELENDSNYVDSDSFEEFTDAMDAIVYAMYDDDFKDDGTLPPSIREIANDEVSKAIVSAIGGAY